MNRQSILIIFVKNLVLGKVKTRLAATIGDDNAFEVYKHLITHTNSVTKTLKAAKIVYYSDAVEHNDTWDDSFLKAQQQGADLGERMMTAFKDIFQQGYTKAVIIGTDCPSVNEGIIEDAFGKLNTADIVIGPAFDGGYYLLGMKKLHSNLFEKINWSTPTVFDTTIAKCTNLNLSYSVLPLLHDIDEEKDLVHLKTARL
jgi:rSAM/selenodomain-associated transferase 1